MNIGGFTNSNKGRSPKESFPESQGNRKYYTPVFILYYNDYEPVSLSNRYIERPQFTETIASMLRTNVARNILSGITIPFDLARRARKHPMTMTMMTGFTSHGFMSRVSRFLVH